MKNQNGITLIALIITIIVMLIIVGVTVNVALNGGLFETAQKAGKQTELETDRELLTGAVLGALAEDSTTVDFEKLDKNLPNGFTGKSGTYTSSNGNTFTVEKNGNIREPKPPVELPQGWTEANKPEGWSDKVTAITDGTNVVPLPDGFEISKNEKEDSIAEGLVVKEGANEFVWIPVANAETYVEDHLYSLRDIDSNSNAPYDSQETLNYYYGEGFFNYAEDFNYAQDKTNIEENIQTYGGFYVGRYETTIDEKGTIGVQKNKPILTSATIIKEGTNPNITTSENKYYYRWWGLYKVQKDVYASNASVGSLMITSKQWDEIMTYTGYGNSKRLTDTYTNKPDLSGSVYKTDSAKCDVSKNIYDLAGNVCECTMKPDLSFFRVRRGSYYDYSNYSASNSLGYIPYDYDSGTR